MAASDSQRIACRTATLAEILPLRHAELRPGLPLASAYFEGDEAPSTLHIGAFDAGGGCVACASFMRNEFDGEPAYQLRGMAVRADARGRGIGGKLLAFGMNSLEGETDVRRVWCNAREAAVPFYQKHGWEVVGSRFDIPSVGPHFRMTRRID